MSVYNLNIIFWVINVTIYIKSDQVISCFNYLFWPHKEVNANTDVVFSLANTIYILQMYCLCFHPHCSSDTKGSSPGVSFKGANTHKVSNHNMERILEVLPSSCRICSSYSISYTIV